MKTLRGGDSSFILSLAAFNVGPKSFLVSGSFKEISIWNVNDGSLLKSLNGHSDWVTSLTVLNEEADGMPLISSGSNDATVKIWNTGTGDLLTTLRGHIGYVLSLAVSSSKPNVLYSSSADSTIKSWNSSSG